MRHFDDNAEITIEPFRATGFPVLRDLVVDRSAFDRIIQAGGYTGVRVGSAPEANSTRVAKEDADLAMDAAQCIACGACVAACPNASASLFTSAKISHLALLPQGQVEKSNRARNMVAQMDAEGFGHCTNHGECERSCPKGISLRFIAMMNRELLSATLASKNPLPARTPQRGEAGSKA
jgi:succinate dehydrogenase / fumarate reductase iron-sulfur subunit